MTAKRTNPLKRLLAARKHALLLALSLAAPLAGGCNIRQIVGLDMYNQPKARVYRASDFFENGSSARPLVENTVPRSEVYSDRSSAGVDPLYLYVGDNYPPNLVQNDKGEDQKLEGDSLKSLLERGQTKYNIYCAVCHGQSGLGDGMIVQRGFSKPPPFVIPPNVEEKEAIEKGEPNRWARTTFLQTAPPRHIYNAISNGFGGMYSYGERVAPRDRWAIAAYVKALHSTPPEVAAKPHTRPSAEKPETH